MNRFVIIILLLSGIIPIYAQDVTVRWGRHGGCTGRGLCTINTSTERTLLINETSAKFQLTEENRLLLRIDRNMLPSQKIQFIVNDQLENTASDHYLPITDEVPLYTEVQNLLRNKTSIQLSKISVGNYRVEISEAFIDIILIEE
jgi:hypothetical protein